jgi:hypothetical protein
MSFRDDFNSRSGTSSSYRGGAGGYSNGGVGGGGNGAANRTGLTTGSTWRGNTAFGPAGGMATHYGMAAPSRGGGSIADAFSAGSRPQVRPTSMSLQRPMQPPAPKPTLKPQAPPPAAMPMFMQPGFLNNLYSQKAAALSRWPGQNSYFGAGKVGKIFDDRVPSGYNSQGGGGSIDEWNNTDPMGNRW